MKKALSLLRRVGRQTPVSPAPANRHMSKARESALIAAGVVWIALVNAVFFLHRICQSSAMHHFTRTFGPQ